MPRMTFEQRLFSKININTGDPDACWMWAGAKNSYGYGHIWGGAHTPAGNPRPVKAYRAVYEIYNGPIAPGKHLDHICHVRDRKSTRLNSSHVKISYA